MNFDSRNIGSLFNEAIRLLVIDENEDLDYFSFFKIDNDFHKKINFELHFYSKSNYEKSASILTELINKSKRTSSYLKQIEFGHFDLIITFYRAFCYYCLNDYKSAMNDLAIVINKDLNYYYAHELKGDCYTQLNDYSKAIQSYNIAILLNNQDSELYCKRAFVITEINEAIVDYNSAIKLHPENYKAYINRGRLFKNIGEINLSSNDFNKAISLINRFNQIIKRAEYLKIDESFFQLGNAQYAIGLIKDAIESYTNAIINDNNNNAIYFFTRGKSKESIEDFNGAIEDYTKAIEINSQESDFHYHQGVAYFSIGKFKDAITNFSNAILISPNSTKLYYNRALARYNIKDYSDCLNDLIYLLKITPDDIDALYLEAKAWFDYDKKNKNAPACDIITYDFKLSISDLMRIIEIDNNCVIAYNFLVDIKIELESYNEAINIILFCKRINLKINLDDKLWACYCGLNKNNDALELALRIYKNKADTNYPIIQVAYSYQRLGYYKLAIKFYNEYILKTDDKKTINTNYQYCLKQFLEPKLINANIFFENADYNNSKTCFEKCIEFKYKLSEEETKKYLMSCIKSEYIYRDYPEINESITSLDDNTKIKMIEKKEHEFFGFGKYKNETIKNVLKSDSNYILWCIVHVDWFRIDNAILLHQNLKIKINYKIAIVFNLLKESIYKDWKRNYYEEYNYDSIDDSNLPSSSFYGGIYGCSDDTIDECFDGDPDNYWNID